MFHPTSALDARPEAHPMGRPAIDAPAAPATDERKASDEARLHHLFRHALRAGQVNPLLHLVPACRGASAP